MARHIVVDLQGLRDAGCRLETEFEVIVMRTVEHEESTPQVEVQRSYVKALLGNGRFFILFRDGTLGWFYCRDERSPNHWFEAWLIEQRVDYTAY